MSPGAAIQAKEWAQIWRDPSTFGLVVVLPLLLMMLFGSAISLDTEDTATGVVDLDRTPASRSFVQSLEASRYFAVTEGQSVGSQADGLVAGRLRGILVIPEGFGRQAGAGPVQLVTDGSQPNTARFLDGHMRGALGSWDGQRLQDRGGEAVQAIGLIDHFRYNPGLESRFMLVPGAIAIVMAMIGTLLTALVMAREYERKTMEGLLATPLSTGALVYNKVLPYFVLGLASTGLCVAMAVYGYGLPFEGSIFALFLIAASFLAAVLGQGLLISAATKSQFVSTQFALLSGFLPSLLLSGFLFEIDSMPAAVQWLTYIVPARYLIPSLQSVFLAGDIWPLFLPNIAIMAGFGAFFLWRSMKAIRRTIA